MKGLDVKLMQNPHAMQALLETSEKKLVECIQHHLGVQEHLFISLIV